MKNSFAEIIIIILAATIIETVGGFLNFHAAKLRNTGLEALPISMLMIALITYMLGGVAWYRILRITNGNYTGAASIWALISAILSIFLAIVVGQRQTVGEWFGFSLIVIGVLVRSLFSN